MSAPAAAITQDPVPVTASGHRGLLDPNPKLRHALEEHLQLERRTAEPRALGLQRAATLIEPSLGATSAPAACGIVARGTGRTSSRAAIDARRLDRRSRAWLDALRSPGVRREEAIGRLHALLLREARFEVGRRTASLAHPSGRDLDDLAMQAANDALVAILAKLDQFRGESLFTTWARRKLKVNFAQA
jgi:hypothetical protein